ncbi:MAG: isochorismatase family cysteine hydrolase [Thermoplasmata archaeon]|nr:isochorismatase family cysteine hydrolase [Thermoplasmata archaeon]
MRALVVVDYQNDFVDGSLGSPDAVSIEDAVCSRMEEHLASGDRVIVTMDTHGEDYLSTYEGTVLPVEHCIRGTPGWALHGRVAELAEREGCRILEKHTFGCAALLDELKGCDEIELCGVATNICVLANAVIARTACPDARIVVRRDCVASYDRELGEKALAVLPSLQIEVL